MKRKIRTVKGLFDKFYDQFLCRLRVYFGCFVAFYMPHFALRVKCVIS